MKNLILKLARRSWQMSQHSVPGELAHQLAIRLEQDPAQCLAQDVSQFMSPLATLALNGDKPCRQAFSDTLLAMAKVQWGIEFPGVPGNRLSDAFCMRSVTEAFKLLLARDLIETDRIETICRWLFDLAMFRIDGRLESQPDYHGWQNRNQNVPATFLYEVADLIEHSPWSASMDYQSLYRWSDAQMTGWDLNWRSPDDAWLYQFIWAWGAYRHACLRRPELLNSTNAIKSGLFYKTLYCPDDEPVVFGESNPEDYIAPAVGLLLGASMANDGQMVWLAQRMLQRFDRHIEKHGDHPNLLQRGPEFHRLYTLVDQCPPPQPFEKITSQYMTSPIAGQGWSIGCTPYNHDIKTKDPRFPALGKNLYDNDALYQIQDPAQYQTKPDKIVFGKSITPGSFFALTDLRAQGLHDHPDVPGVALLTRHGLPWLVESVYMPREENRVRWLHNVPVYRKGHVGVQGLMSHEADTYREPTLEQVYFKTNVQNDEPSAGAVASASQKHIASDKQADVARVIIPHDAFDYLNFDGSAFTIDRTFIYIHANDALLVIDRLIAAIKGQATIAQAWHTPATIAREAHGFALHQSGKPHTADSADCASNGQDHTKPSLDTHPLTLPVATASSVKAEAHLHQHMPTQLGCVHYNGPINDLLLHAHVTTRPGDLYCLAAGFGIVPGQLILNHHGHTTFIRCANVAITLGSELHDVTIRELDPAAD